MRGRKPVPAALRAITGVVSRRPITTNAPPPLDPAVPAELTEATARREWTRVLEYGLFAATDRALVVAHCALWARWLVQVGEAGQAGAHKTLTLLTRIDGELGLTPASRARVQPVERPRKDNPLARYLPPNAG